MTEEFTAIFVYDMAPEGMFGLRYIVAQATASPGMMLGPVAAGPFTSGEEAAREAARLEEANPLRRQSD